MPPGPALMFVLEHALRHKHFTLRLTQMTTREGGRVQGPGLTEAVAVQEESRHSNGTLSPKVKPLATAKGL